jgi:hypothetical protein
LVALLAEGRHNVCSFFGKCVRPLEGLHGGESYERHGLTLVTSLGRAHNAVRAGGLHCGGREVRHVVSMASRSGGFDELRDRDLLC